MDKISEFLCSLARELDGFRCEGKGSWGVLGGGRANKSGMTHLRMGGEWEGARK